MLKSWFFVVALFAIQTIGLTRTFADAPPPKKIYTPLKEMRTNGTLPHFPDYTLDEEKFVLSQARLLLLGMYAHLGLKQEIFPDSARPEPKLDELSDDLASSDTPMNPNEFHTRLMRIFKNERDLHTVYRFPMPYACYTSALPFSLDVVKSDGNPKLAVSKITAVQDIISHSPGLEKMSVGDVIELYDGNDPIDSLSDIDENNDLSFKELGGGANRSARRRRAIEKLVFLSQATDPFPQNNEVQFHVRKRNGNEFDISFPWIEIADPTCLKPTEPHPDDEGTDIKDTKDAKAAHDAIDEYETQFQQLFKDADQKNAWSESRDELLDLSSLTQTQESTLKYKILVRKDENQPDRKFGYLRLDSFQPTLPYESVLTMIQDLLSKEFSDSEGLIIDLRNNGGGTISYGEELIQLFAAAKVETEQFRLRATPENRDFLSSTNGFSDTFLNLLNSALEDGDYYTDTAPLTSSAKANDRGRVYFKPVAVLTNSSCYSTCDMFTAGMQDNRAAKIWSEDHNTGGGGANNMSYASFSSTLKPDATFKLPTLPSGQSMGIAWRQALRVGKHAGELLEDKGVRADRGDNLPSSPDDLAFHNLETIRTITDSLIGESEKFKASAIFDTEGDTLDAKEGQPFKLEATVADTTRIDFYSEDATGEKLLGSQAVQPPEDSAQTTEVEIAIPAPSHSCGRVSFQAYRDDRPVWRKTLIVRKIPEAVVAPATFDLNSSGLPFGMAIYTADSDLSKGWTLKGERLQLGQGPTYVNNLSSQTSIFVSLPSGTSPKLSFNASVDTEKNYDIFSVSVIGAKTQNLLKEFSGKIADTHYSFDLAQYAGQTVEIRFNFSSDQGIVGPGVFVYGISVK